MEVNEALEKLKNDYQEIKPSTGFREYGWERLLSRLDEEPRLWWQRWFSPWGLKFAFAALGLVLFLTGGTWAAAQSSNPGGLLYPVKRLSEEVVQQLFPQKLIKLEHRGQELKNLIENQAPAEKVKSGAEDFKKEVTRSSDSVKNLEKEGSPKAAGAKEQLREQLSKEEEKLRNIEAPKPQSQIIKEALETAQETVKESLPLSPLTSPEKERVKSPLP